MKPIIKELRDAILSEELLVKHIYKHQWISGSSTIVYPIQYWQQEVEVQLDTHKGHYFKKYIERMKKKFPHLFRSVYFCKNDGSCPSTMVFWYTDEVEKRLATE